MDTPAAGARGRRRVPAAVPLVLVARLDRAAAAPPVVDHIRLWCRTRRRRLVDGFLRPRRPGERVAVPAGVSPHACLRHFRSHPVDRAGFAAARARGDATAAANERLCDSASCPVPDLSRRDCRRHARGTRLQHLAADRRRLCADRIAAVLRAAGVAEFFRERADRSVRSPDGCLCLVDRGHRARHSCAAYGAWCTARWRIDARRCGHAASRSRYHGAAVSSAACACAAASGDRDRRSYRRRCARRAALGPDGIPHAFLRARHCHRLRHSPAPVRGRR